MESNIKWLVAAGHEMASELKAECGAVDMRSVAKLISDLAMQLEVQLVRANALAEDQQKAIESIKQADAAVKLAHEKFSALAAENARCLFEVSRCHQTVDEMFHHKDKWFDKEWLSALWSTSKQLMENTPATDAFLAEVRAQGVEMAMEHMQSSGSLTFGDCYISLNEFAAELRKGGNQ
ncbi:hypothetical protein LHT05_000719 [Escherichia coli]|nr:hypothetical protein [Escherichia coli]